MSSTNPTANPPNWSLRFRLITLLLLATGTLWAIAAISIYRETNSESRELFDEALRETAHLLLRIIEHESEEHGPDYAVALIQEYPATHYLRFQVWNREGRLVYRSFDTPVEPLATSHGEGYAWTRIGNTPARVYSAWNPSGTLQVQIGEPLSHRRQISERTLVRVAAFAALMLPISAAFFWWIIARTLRPIAETSAAVAERTEQNLTPVALKNVPQEVAPLVSALNRLLQRIRDTIAYERRFTADAAHELRTPLAAIRAHAQVLQNARTDEEAREAVQDIIKGVDRSRRLIDQLLTLARVDATQAATRQRLDLATLIEMQVEEHRTFAEKQGVHVTMETSPVEIECSPDAIDILLRNLIDNALRYTPAGGRVVVSCGMKAGSCEMAVRDNGTGIPPEERERVMERFYRLVGSASFGSGLGLSIVQRIVELHGAKLTVEAGLDGRGTSFVIAFPA